MTQTRDTRGARVLVSAYEYHPAGVSEAWTAHQLVTAMRGIGRRLFVLTRATPNKPRWPAVARVQCLISKSASLWIPNYLEYALRTVPIGRRLRRQFGLVHHISPITLRLPSALGALGLPFIWGPVGGSIPYPPGFEAYARGRSLTDILRRLDGLRLKLDPSLAWTLACASRIVVTSSMAGELIPSRHRSKVLLIPEGVPEDFVAPNSGSDGHYLFSSGRLVPYKALDLLIKAFARLRPSASIRLVITGDGPMKGPLQSLIQRLGLTDVVALKGRVSREENRALMKGAMACVFPSLREAFGHVNLEAMGFGKPVLVTDWGGPRDLIEQRVTGLKVLGMDPAAHVTLLAEAMRELIEDRALRFRLGAAAAERVHSFYTWPRLARRYGALYDELAV
jgi:glycosyltransferase involved in cell wall biosynthesis